MKKIFALFAPLLMVLSVTACNVSPVEPDARDSEERITYTDDQHGFSFTFPEKYEGFTADFSKSNFEGRAGVVIFRVDATGTTWSTNFFNIFAVNIYHKDWWNKQVAVNKDNQAYLSGSGDLSGYIGGYLGANNKYMFTSHRGQDCPGNPENPKEQTWQCKLFITAPEIIKSFQAFDVN